MSTNTGNRGPLKRMNTTPYVRHIVPFLWTQSLKKQCSKIAAAPADSHGADHTAQFVAASQGGGGGGQLLVHFCVLQFCGHAILHWFVRKQPQRIEFKIKWSWPFVKHTKVPSTATNITKQSGEYTHPIPYSLFKSRYVIMLKKAD